MDCFIGNFKVSDFFCERIVGMQKPKNQEFCSEMCEKLKISPAMNTLPELTTLASLTPPPTKYKMKSKKYKKNLEFFFTILIFTVVHNMSAIYAQSVDVALAVQNKIDEMDERQLKLDNQSDEFDVETDSVTTASLVCQDRLDICSLVVASGLCGNYSRDCCRSCS